MRKTSPITFAFLLAVVALGFELPAAALGQDSQAGGDPNAVRQNWPRMTIAEFAESVITSHPVRQEWDKAKRTDYDQAVFAEAARRMMARGVDFAEVALYAEDMLRWSGKAWDEEGRRAFLVQALVEGDAASKLPAKLVSGLVPDAKKLLTPEQFEQLGQSLASLPDTLRQGWGGRSTVEFADSVTSSGPLREEWPQERHQEYRRAIFAEAGRRLMAADEDFSDVVKPFKSLLDWSFKGWDDDQKRAFLVKYLIDGDAAAKLPARRVDDLVVHAKELLTPEQFEQVKQKFDSVSKSAKDASYEDLWEHLQRTFHLTDRTYEDIQERRKWVADWIRTHDLSKSKDSSLRRLLQQAISPATHGMVEMEAE